MTHIILHLAALENKNILRMVVVDTCADIDAYFSELNEKYGSTVAVGSVGYVGSVGSVGAVGAVGSVGSVGPVEVGACQSRVNTDNVRVLYNLGLWFERLGTDLMYKKFSTLSIDFIVPYVWEITSNNDEDTLTVEMLSEFFCSHLETFITQKIASYIDDFGATWSSMLESRLAKIDALDTNYSAKTVSNTSEKNKNSIYNYIHIDETLAHELDTTPSQNNPDYWNTKLDEYNEARKTFDSIYVLPSIVKAWGSDEYFLDDMTLLAITKIVAPRGFDETNRVCLAPEDFEMTYHPKLMGYTIKSNKVTFIECKKILYVYRGNVDTSMFGFCFEKEDPINDFDNQEMFYKYSSPAQWSQSDVLKQFDFKQKKWDIGILNDSTINHYATDNKTSIDQSQPRKIQCFQYKNNLKGKVFSFMTPIRFLKEFEHLGVVEFYTQTGFDIHNMLHDKTDYANIEADMVSIIGMLKKIRDVQVKNTTGLFTGTANMQKLQTKEYVDIFKDDNEEQLASNAILNVKDYLSKHMHEYDINLNNIGRDLVDLGVKKSRKSKGFVYGLSSAPYNPVIPSYGTIYKIDTCSKTPSKNPNLQLRSEPKVPNLASSLQWGVSSWMET